MKIAQTWYSRVEPYITSDEPEEEVKRQHGEDITFREFDPKPDFYVRKASIDAQIPRGQFVGNITEISSDQSINKKPMRFKVAGENMRHRDREELSGEFNYINKAKGYSKVNYLIRQYQLDNFEVSKSKKLPVTIAKSLMNLDLSARLQDKQVTGNSDIRFKKVKFLTGDASSGSSFSKMLKSSFAGVDKFNINARFKGNKNDIDIDLKSDLDNQLGDQLKAQINKKKEQFEANLKSRIDDKLKEPLAKIEAKKKHLDQIKRELDTKEKEI